jgi:CRISPR system Cascade subunit CasB
MASSRTELKSSIRHSLFSRDSDSAEALVEWWRKLSNDPAARARLRRCHRAIDTILHPEFHRLAARLPDGNPSQLAPLVRLLAFVEHDDPDRSLGASLGEKLSEARFRRLIETPDRQSAAEDLRSAVGLLGRRANVLALAQAVYFWGDLVRRRLATEYYGGRE